MNKPKFSKQKNKFLFQRLITLFGIFFTGIACIAVLTQQLVNLKKIPPYIAIIGLILTVALLIFLKWYTNKYGIWWKNRDGKSYKIKKLKLYVYVIFFGLFSAFVYPVVLQNGGPPGLKPIFPPDNQSFKVLILPFNNFYKDGECQIEAGKCLFRDLKQEAYNRNLDISPHYYDNYETSMNFNSDSARQIVISNNADLTIYGDYKQVDGDDYIKFAYYLKEGWEIEGDKSIPESGYLKVNLDDFSNGTLKTGDAAFIINWVIGLSELRKYNFQSSSNSFKYLLESIEFDIPDTSRLDLYQFYISSCAKLGEYEEGFEYVEKAMTTVKNNQAILYPSYYASLYQLKSLLSAFITDNENALIYANEALNAYRTYKVDDEEILLRILNSLQTANGYLLTQDGIETAIAYGKQIIELLQDKKNKSNSDFVNYGLAYGNIGAEFNDLGFPDSAIIYINKSNGILTGINPTDSTLIARNYANKGVSLNLKQDYQESLKFLNHAYNIEARLIPKNLQHASTSRNLGSTYIKLISIDSTYADSAIHFLNEARLIQESISPLPVDIIKAYGEISIAYFYKNDFEKTKKNLLKSVEIAEDYFSENLPILSQQYYAAALLFFKIDEIESSIKYFQKGAKLYEELSPDAQDYQMITTIHNFLLMKLPLH